MTITEILQMIITADNSQAKEALNDLNEEVDKLKSNSDSASSSSNALAAATGKTQSGFKALTGAIAGTISKYLALSAITASAINFMKEASAAAEEENRGLARLQAVIETTGRAAETSSLQIDSLVDDLERLTYADKQAVMDAASSLAIMENVSTDLFAGIFQTANDLYHVVGTDIGSAVETLGRAMEDPIEGMTRLRRMGIFVSDEMQDQIKELIEQNRLYDAQVLLLSEIQGKVEGTAEAVAEVSSNLRLQTSWDRFVGSAGQALSGTIEPVTDALSFMLDAITSSLDDSTVRKTLGNLTRDVIDSMSLGELEAAMAMYDSLEKKSMIGEPMEYTAFYQLNLGYLKERLEAERKIYAELQKQEEEAEKQRAIEKEKQKQLSNEKSITEELYSLYSMTDEGHIANLQRELDALELQHEADKILAESTSLDKDVLAIIQERLPLYEAVIAAKQQEIAGLTDIAEEAETQSLVEKILGTSAENYVLNIPISYDFGRSSLETMEEQLSTLKTAINSLWKQNPGEEELEEWGAALNTLVAQYDSLNEKIEETRANEERIKNTVDLWKAAEEELNKLLSEEEQKKKELADYEERLQEMLDAKVLTQEQFNELLEQERENLGLSTSAITDWEAALRDISASFESFVEANFSYQALGNDISSIFYEWGSAMGSGEDAIDSLSSSLGSWVQDLLKQMSSLFISAGLRVIVDGGLAALPLGLTLMAMGGVTGLSAGIMGSTSSAISDDILEGMQDEMDARQKLADSLNESIDTEYELLRRQFERNLISEEAFREGAGDLQQQRNEADARVAISEAIYNEIASLNSEYSQMSGWDKFWSGRDEKILKEINSLEALYDSIDSASVEQLRSLLNTLKNMGVSVGSVPAFANGGNFVTNGPQLILVGDNSSGKERVSITPIDGSSSLPDNQGTIININGDVYGWEDLYAKLQAVGMKIERRKRA